MCKAYKNSGRFRFHRKKTKQAWKHYFIDLEDEKFGTEWISSINLTKFYGLHTPKLRIKNFQD